MLSFHKIGLGNYECTLDLNLLYPTPAELQRFDEKWEDFYTSDETNQHVLFRKGNIITYPHKSWVPEVASEKPSLLIVAGNPAPHSVWKDIYYAYEEKGLEHRFWKVLRELEYINLYGKDLQIKEKFLNLDYISPFRMGFEVIFTFPSTASKPKWSGVLGLEKLFGRKYLHKLFELEKVRLGTIVDSFFSNSHGQIIAMQKDAYNALSEEQYAINLAVAGKLKGNFNGTPVTGTPPTRWLHTAKMKDLLRSLKNQS